MFEEYFSILVPSAFAKQLYKIKNKKENHGLVELIRVTWSNLKDKIEHMSKKKKKKMKNQIKYQKLLKKFLRLIEKNNQDKVQKY